MFYSSFVPAESTWFKTTTADAPIVAGTENPEAAGYLKAFGDLHKRINHLLKQVSRKLRQANLVFAGESCIGNAGLRINITGLTGCSEQMVIYAEMNAKIFVCMCWFH